MATRRPAIGGYSTSSRVYRTDSAMPTLVSFIVVYGRTVTAIPRRAIPRRAIPTRCFATQEFCVANVIVHVR